MSENGQLRHTKVSRLRILKPANGGNWKELAALFRDVRYRVFRLGNLAVSEAYLAFHHWRTTGKSAEYEKPTIGQLNQRLRDMLIDEEKSAKPKRKNRRNAPSDHDRFSKKGALPSYVADALWKYKVMALTAPTKWKQVITGKATLPTFRLNGPIFIRCDRSGNRRLERTESGEVELDLMICCKPYPRVVLATKEKGVGQGQLAILHRLLENEKQSLDGYRQRCFEVKHDERSNKWWLYITYDFPATQTPGLSPERIVGVDLGFSCPLFVAINNGHARMGRRHYAALGARVRSLQRQTIARRRSIQRGGRVNLASETARTGHGRKRKLRPIEKLEGRIDSAYSTLNHQLAASVIDFAKNHGAGVIQIEDLDGLKAQLAGTFIGMNWRYHELQQYIDYKANEAGIEVRKIKPRYTSRRCSKCGHIHKDFDRAARDAAGRRGFSTRFICPECGFTADADYNAARNIATVDIERIIVRQCKAQGLTCDDDALSQDEREAAVHATLAD